VPGVRSREIVGQDGILRADGIGALRTGLLIGNRPVDNRLQDDILPHCRWRLGLYTLEVWA
jgi:hypothetical protein